MYAGSPYAGAPYAGGSTASTAEVVDGSFEGVVVLVETWLDLVESDAAVSLPAVPAQRYDKVRVLPTPDLRNGRPT